MDMDIYKENSKYLTSNMSSKSKSTAWMDLNLI